MLIADCKFARRDQILRRPAPSLYLFISLSHSLSINNDAMLSAESLAEKLYPFHKLGG